MAPAKSRKYARNPDRIAASRDGQRSAAKATAAGESDSDHDDTLLATAFAAGGNAYEALVGALDGPTSQSRQHASSRQKKKAKLPIETESEPWRQQPRIQPASDARADQSSALEDKAVLAAPQYHENLTYPHAAEDQADEPAADHFLQHFQQATLEEHSTPTDGASADTARPAATLHKAEWPHAEWVNTGLPFPKVSSPFLQHMPAIALLVGMPSCLPEHSQLMLYSIQNTAQ